MGILEEFKKLEDPRRVRKNIIYPFEEILFLCLTGIMSGNDSWDDIVLWGEEKIEWLRKFFEYKNGICSEDTLQRIFKLLNFKKFSECFIAWINSIVKDKVHIAIDGKYLNGNSKLGMVHAYNIAEQALVGIVSIEGKGHEISGIKELLDLIDIKNSLISIDALGCQVDIIKKISEKNADYLLQVKGNQGNLYEDIEYFCKNTLIERESKRDFYEELEKDNGRLIKRECIVYSDIEWLNERNIGFNISNVIHITRTRYKNRAEEIREDAYYISSKKDVDAEYFLQATRNHWHIENKLHWILDVVFNEDNNKIYNKNEAKNFALMTRISRELLKNQALQNSEKNKKPSIKKMCKKNMCNPEYMNTLFI